MHREAPARPSTQLHHRPEPLAESPGTRPEAGSASEGQCKGARAGPRDPSTAPRGGDDFSRLPRDAFPSIDSLSGAAISRGSRAADRTDAADRAAGIVARFVCAINLAASVSVIRE